MPIEGVILEHSGIAHRDPRGALSGIFNSDLGDFCVRHIDVKDDVPEDAWLGGHYHPYRELHYVISGEATFELEDKGSKERETYCLNPRCRLLIPAFVAHRARVRAGTILLSCAESVYSSAELNDHKYEF
ncbi:MAG TPA: hypothetical protein HA282_01255 [Nanoarchaeota archaeon]|nr:WxcM-like domain-containing protein [Candidatus Pacearchaeota archaeon]HIH17979.1 hypothetical protein [Nanoarchaeota archaeon]HIH33847.1 hypothetical protein [Nanoarchaeota archaeon]HIH50790.1 hypothetical protein [Nanoarchaeota archaeon]HIH65826.1 hypothetical protein [Nanoarchaeota archaeon]